MRIAEQLAYGEYQPDDVLDYGLPSVDPLAIGPGEATPLAVLITGQLGAVLYLSRRSPYDSVEESDVDWLWEIELYRRSSDGGWGDGDWNYDPWPDPNIELERSGPVMLLSDLRGIVTTEKAQYVIGGMASAGVHAVEIRTTTDRRRVGVNRNRAFLLELPEAGTSLTLVALDGNDEVITGPSGSLAFSFAVPQDQVRQGTTWTTIGVLPPVLRA